ncbi:hypothetical protein HRR83_009408 [Exophiala dermatitidis]|uniref:FAD dependent oxidoreductase domain-containing protein n=1 Tax=Exophiala dermatitidis TaxID=5970 RepID=A0AAN6ELV3_EXODE|nr:hypothetical protein HRR73_009303 [Exophiala dermatitidis]KAJ4515190.1 hypothetical protein HRR74_005656 [Exophiala dermatitidis]KAJ4552723.1 hypothetical protein HRR77_002722 [Exophiala dermatitidis]KAJ4554863.1 hypothetical protein HRR79_009304 [Exophiala dermatitidis]KAJ4561515.1 hypothetical protein HRR81_009400 [Exophiala dermatitidis]
MGPIMASSSHVVVIGAGILGLTAAIQIQDLIQSRSLPYKILLVAKDFPVITPGDPTTSPSPNYASMHAGAHVRPIPASSPQLAREARWLKRACQVFAAQATHEPWMGVIQVPGVEYFEDPVPEHYRNLDAESFHQQSGLTGFRRLDDATKLPKGVNLGYEYQTYCIYSSVYCAALLRKFILKGGQVLRQELKCEDEAFSLADRVELVVNASGMGFGDRNCFPIRGQVVLTNLQANKTITRQNANGTWSFVIPRAFGEGTIVGGTKEPHDWDARARPASTETLVASALKDLGALDENDQKTSCSRPVTVVKEVVGRRPAREGGVRLEIEERASPRQETDHGTKNKFEENSTMTIVHAYGAGGRGYEISWGIADEVCGLVEQVMHRRRREHLREKENVSVRARARL